MKKKVKFNDKDHGIHIAKAGHVHHHHHEHEHGHVHSHKKREPTREEIIADLLKEWKPVVNVSQERL